MQRRGSHSPERTYVVLAVLASAVTLTGVQSLLPALPAMEEALGLSPSQLSLVMSVYLFPSVVFAIPAGLLADRFGRRIIYCVALGVFGLCGVLQGVVHTFPVIMVARAIQGCCFAAILPLSITMIADVRRGTTGVKMQGYRTVTMSSFDAGLPVIGGVVVALAWYAPFFLQALTLPLAVLGWRFISPALSMPAPENRLQLRLIRPLLFERVLMLLHTVSFARFFFKFAVFAYYPSLAVGQHGMSPVLVGIALGFAAFVGAVGAGMAGRLTRVMSPRAWMVGSILAIGAALVGIALARVPVVSIVAVTTFGLADGVLSVFVNSYVATEGRAEYRATVVSMNGAVRNFGKFIAPVLMGLLVGFSGIPGSFLVFAALTLLFVAAARQLPRTVRMEGSEQPGHAS